MSIPRQSGVNARRTAPRSARKCRRSPARGTGLGYRQIGVLLERKGMSMNHKKLYSIYREEGL
ncbi:hypothetical protein GCM10022290_26500 [Sagittula marina]